MKLVQALLSLPVGVIVGVTRSYQFFISPMLGQNCRFTPSCSEYMLQSVQEHGAVVGVWRGLYRICRCHPWNPGGYDPP